jgi:allantoicase
MRTIDSKKIIGVRIWEDDEKWRQINHFVRNPNNSWRILEFKNVGEIDKLIKDLKKFKRDFNEAVKNGHI